MTKTYVKCFSVLIYVLLICTSFTACLQEKTTTEKADIEKDFVFKLDDYKSFTNSFRREINVGKIEDSNDVISKADRLFIETFGEETMENERPYQAFYDEISDCWYVKGTFYQNSAGTRKGGVANVIFDSEGNVLALWHEK